MLKNIKFIVITHLIIIDLFMKHQNQTRREAGAESAGLRVCAKTRQVKT